MSLKIRGQANSKMCRLAAHGSRALSNDAVLEARGNRHDRRAIAATSQIYLTTLNLTDSAAIFSVNGVRYEYFLERSALDKLTVIWHKSAAKALNFAKRNALRWQRLEDA